MKTVRKQRAISPVIATIILVAVTLVVAVAVGSYVFGLFGASSRGPQVHATLYSLTVAAPPPGGTLSVTFSNSGGSAVNVVSASITISSTTYTATAGGTTALLASTTSNPATTFAFSTAPFTAGQTYSFSIAFSDGSQQTIVVVAQ